MNKSANQVSLFTVIISIYAPIVLAATPPSAPTIGAVTVGDAQATVAFTAPATNGGSPITQYTATSSPDSITGSCKSSPCIVKGLSNGRAYTFTVVAINSVGKSQSSAQSDSVAPIAPHAPAKPSDNTKLKPGDRVVFPFQLNANYIDPNESSLEKKKVCIPGNTGLRVINIPNDLSNGKIVFQVADLWESKTCSNNDQLKADLGIEIDNTSNAVFEKNHPSVYGLTYGTLVIPFKLQLRGNRDISGESTIGGYVGRRFAYPGSESEIVFTAGLSSIPVTQTSGSQTTTKNITGVTYGIGLIGSINNSFQMGVVLGYDHVARDAGYQYRDLPWIAVSLGLSMSK